MTETTNYSLKKPDPSDRVLIADLNENSDKIDAELKKNADTIQTVSNKADENETAISELQSKIIADNFVKRIRITNNRQNTYVKIAEIDTNQSSGQQCAFVLTGGANFGGYEVPVLLVTINERDSIKPRRAILFSGKANDSPKIVLKRSEDMLTTEVFVNITSNYPSDINIIILENFANSSVSFFYDQQKVDSVEKSIEIPIETVTTSSDFATSDEVTNMLNEVFDTSATAVSDEEASDMEVLNYEE